MLAGFVSRLAGSLRKKVSSVSPWGGPDDDYFDADAVPLYDLFGDPAKADAAKALEMEVERRTCEKRATNYECREWRSAEIEDQSGTPKRTKRLGDRRSKETTGTPGGAAADKYLQSVLPEGDNAASSWSSSGTGAASSRASQAGAGASDVSRPSSRGSERRTLQERTTAAYAKPFREGERPKLELEQLQKNLLRSR